MENQAVGIGSGTRRRFTRSFDDLRGIAVPRR